MYINITGVLVNSWSKVPLHYMVLIIQKLLSIQLYYLAIFFYESHKLHCYRM